MKTHTQFARSFFRRAILVASTGRDLAGQRIGVGPVDQRGAQREPVSEVRDASRMSGVTCRGAIAMLVKHVARGGALGRRYSGFKWQLRGGAVRVYVAWRQSRITP